MSALMGTGMHTKRERALAQVTSAAHPEEFVERLKGLGCLVLEDTRFNYILSHPKVSAPVSIRKGSRVTLEDQCAMIDTVLGYKEEDHTERITAARAAARLSQQRATKSEEEYVELDAALKRKEGPGGLLPPTIDSLEKEFGGKFAKREISDRARTLQVKYPPRALRRDTVERVAIAYNQGKSADDAIRETKFAPRTVRSLYHYFNGQTGKETELPKQLHDLSAELSKYGKIERQAFVDLMATHGMIVEKAKDSAVHTIENPVTGHRFSNLDISKEALTRNGMAFYLKKLGLPPLTKPAKAGKAAKKSTGATASAEAAAPIVQPPQAAETLAPVAQTQIVSNTAVLELLNSAKQAIRDGQGAAAEYIIDNAAKLLRGE